MLMKFFIGMEVLFQCSPALCLDEGLLASPRNAIINSSQFMVNAATEYFVDYHHSLQHAFFQLLASH